MIIKFPCEQNYYLHKKTIPEVIRCVCVGVCVCVWGGEFVYIVFVLVVPVVQVALRKL